MYFCNADFYPMSKLLIFGFAFLSLCNLYAQDVDQLEKANAKDATTKAKVLKGTIDQYRIISLERDTTYLDTSLSIQKDYKFNYLRKDLFGKWQMANEGQPHNTLKQSFFQKSAFPEIGYNAKHFNYLQPHDVNYYSVATPLTELYFKTVMEEGQTLDALITMNTSERLNFSLAYKGLRSLGKYINELSSAGNFRFTTSYNTANNRYFANAHFTSQDLTNGENGGLQDVTNFTSGDNIYKNRVRINVFSKDASSLLKGQRYFLDHYFLVNRTKGDNNLYVTHQISYESKIHRYKQNKIENISNIPNQTLHFGNSYVSENINDEVNYNQLYNKVGATYENAVLGKFTAFAEDFRSNYFYKRILILQGEVVLGSLDYGITTFGGQYEYRKNKWRGSILAANSLSIQPLTNIEAKAEYALNTETSFSAKFQKINKIPDNLSLLHQSSYVDYNWANSFKNEKFNTLSIIAKSKWLNAEASYSLINDHIFYSNDATSPLMQIVTPKQYNNAISLLSAQIGKEFRYGKFALDNTLLYQKVQQDDAILNVPDFVTRNTLYYSDYFFKRALYLQTGFTVNYFTEFYANEYNPIIGEFFSQDQVKIGNYPTVDFFVNARIQQTRIFVKAEHFNAGLTGNNYLSTPTNPYRDFIIRFGLVWNFFQ